MLFCLLLSVILFGHIIDDLLATCVIIRFFIFVNWKILDGQINLIHVCACTRVTFLSFSAFPWSNFVLASNKRAQFIRITYLCNVYPLEPHFYIAKLVYAGVYLFFLILLQNIDCGYSLELPRPGDSNVYPQSVF